MTSQEMTFPHFPCAPARAFRLVARNLSGFFANRHYFCEEKRKTRDQGKAMFRILKNLLGLKKKQKKPMRKARVLGRLQATCLRETVTREMRRPWPAESKVIVTGVGP